MRTELILEFEWGGDSLKKWIARFPDGGPVLFSIYDCENARKILGLEDKTRTYLKEFKIKSLEG